MNTTATVIERCRINPKLVRAVVRQTGKESLEDIARHGVAGGFAGFTYYTDTVPFFKRNRPAIVELVNRIADDLGETPAEMVAGFQCLAGQSMKHTQGYGLEDDRRLTRENAAKIAEYLPSVYRCLGGGRLTDDDTDVANALAWFAAEEVARAFCDD